MFNWAVATAIFSYFILFLGILGQLSYPYIVLGAGIFVLYSYWILYYQNNWKQYWQIFNKTANFEKILLAILILQAVCNLIGALGPEIAFDAVWYHLTIPKIWLLQEKIFFIPQGPFYYSLLPKLLEMLYIPELLFGNEIIAKTLHWLFGVLTTILTYHLARNFTTRKYALLAAVVFYSNLVVGWQSITAYIDLGRAFYETLALLALIYATKFNSKQWGYTAGLMVGIAVLSKLIALTSATAITGIFIFQKKYSQALLTSLCALVMPAAWFILNFLQTGNPVFPLFSTYDLNSPQSIFDPFTIWFTSADPISPVYMMLFPLVLMIFLSRFKNYFTTENEEKKVYEILVLYCFLTFVLWILTPRTGGGRFLLPYLPAFSVLIIYPLSRIKVENIKKLAIAMILLTSVLSLMYRSVANKKYLPVLLGSQSKEEFLRQNLPADFGDNWYYLTDESLLKLSTQKEKPQDLKWQY